MLLTALNLFARLGLALDRVRADFHSDTESYCGNHSDILSTMEALQGGNSPGDKSPADTSGEFQTRLLVYRRLIGVFLQI